MLSAKGLPDKDKGEHWFSRWTRGWPSSWGFALFLVGAVGVIFFTVASGHESFFFRDFGIFGYPLAQYHRESFWRGEIPLWNPLNNCGLPFLAQWNTLTLYPLSLIYLLIPLPYGLNVYCLAHLVIAGVGTYRLARHWTGSPPAAAVAGAAYCFSGLLLNSLMWPNNLAALAWLPWVLHSVEQAWRNGGRSLPAAAGFGALQMLAGAPEIILLTWLLALFLWVSELRVSEPAWAGRSARQGVRLLGVAVLVGGISAAQLAPFLDLMWHSNRSENFENNTWPMPIWGWVNLLVPLFHCYRSPLGVYFQPGQEWTSSYYSGAAILGLAIGAVLWVRQRRTTALAVAGAFGLVMALGQAGGFYKWVSRAIPFLSVMRFPIKFVVLATVCLPLLAALAVAHWENHRRRADEAEAGQSRCARSLMLIGGILLAAMAGIILFARFQPAFSEEPKTVLINGAVRAAFLGAIFFILMRAKEGRNQSRSVGGTPWEGRSWKLDLRGFALVLLVLLDLITHAPSQNPTVATKALLPGAWGQAGQPTPKPGEGRAFMTRSTHDLLYGSMLANPLEDYMGRRMGLFGNCNLLEGLATPDGFYSLYLPSQRAVWKQLFFAPTNQFPEALADFLAVRYVPTATNLLEWRARASAMPLVTGGQQPVFVGQKLALAGMVSGTFNPNQIVYLPTAAEPAAKTVTRSSVEISKVQFAAHRISFTSKAAAPALAVVAQTYYHCWQATVDGQPVPIWQANHAFQAIQVQQGSHQVLIEYKDRAFQWGLSISAVSLALLAGFWFLGRRVSTTAPS